MPTTKTDVDAARERAKLAYLSEFRNPAEFETVWSGSLERTGQAKVKLGGEIERRGNVFDERAPLN